MKRVSSWALIILGLALVLVLTLAAFGLPVASSLQLLWEGAAGDKFGIARTLVKATPLALTGLAIVVSWRAGMYNIGGEGQFVIGAVCGAAMAKVCWHFPGPLLNLLILVSAIVGGALYAGIAALMQVYRGVQCVISTILLNFIAIQILGWAVSGPLRRGETTMPQSDPLPASAMFLRLDPQSDLHMGVFYALVAALLVYVYMYLTAGGFKLRLVGESPSAAKAARIPSGRVQIQAMLISGGLAGLAGAIQYAGIAGSIGIDTGQNWGFLGIPVALLGGLHPVGVLFSSVYFGALFAGSDNLARFTPSGTMIVYVIQALAVLAFIGFKALLDRRKVRPTEATL